MARILATQITRIHSLRDQVFDDYDDYSQWLAEELPGKRWGTHGSTLELTQKEAGTIIWKLDRIIRSTSQLSKPTHRRKVVSIRAQLYYFLNAYANRSDTTVESVIDQAVGEYLSGKDALFEEVPDSNDDFGELPQD